jgi:6-phospho-3-hexuloisomerase
MADAVITIPAPTSKLEDGGIGTSAQPMGSLFEQALLLVLDALVMEVMDRKGLSSDVMFQKHANLE